VKNIFAVHGGWWKGLVEGCYKILRRMAHGFDPSGTGRFLSADDVELPSGRSPSERAGDHRGSTSYASVITEAVNDPKVAGLRLRNGIRPGPKKRRIGSVAH